MEIQTVIERGTAQRTALLTDISMNLPLWLEKVTREKSIYHTMNLFNYDLGRRCLIAEGWCPIKGAEAIQLALREGRKRSGALIPSVLNIVPTSDTPPTYFQTNHLSSSFQGIVDSYGTARYREVNPAVFTIVTFPFEFGIMFGDVGHGTMMLLAALFMIYMERHWEGTKLNEIIAMVYNGRYMILMMSMFSVYIGALYNELFALPMNFGSNWEFVNEPPYNTFRPVSNWTYPFGVDPVWKGATNELSFYNSLKMKTAVSIGVIQMSLGLFLHFLNGVHFRAYYDVFFEFFPRIIFLLSTFGYLVFMIFWKWSQNYEGLEKSHNAPQLLNEMIYMFLPGNPNGGSPLYPLQPDIQPFLVAFVIISIPWMMLPKPICLLLDHRAQEKGYSSIWALMLRKSMRKMKVEAHVDTSDDLMVLGEDTTDIQGEGGHKAAAGGHGEHGEEFDFSELMVHQGLETIEFILGCVSHTASYLRLWALSLAHSELATVFWEKIMGTFWSYGTTSWVTGGFASFAAFSCWFAATVFVLLGMESLSAFLHALRLHWVEFQSKFYRGDGYPFLPFSYNRKEEE
jgi:V-type H+-transporting ATPase subunit a